jgi:hypothetical protein
LLRDFVAANRAVRHADRRVEQAEVIVDFGYGADRRARAAAGGLLFNGNCGAETVNRIDIRPFHLIQKLARVRGEGFDVAPLPFRINRVKSQGRFAGAAQTRNYGNRITGNLNIDIFQVVLARAMHCDTVQHKEKKGGEG